MTAPPPLPCLALAGPTASGKTATALAFAETMQARHGVKVEIISVDSALVYRGMDIGTAKPGAGELAAVPHHLIDIRDAAQSYSAAEFVTDAQRVAAEIQARGALPLLVGGTMLYFKALWEGLHTMPPADAVVRAALDAEAAVRGWPAMHAELAEVDPVTAARLAPADAQRIQRALEVWRIAGKPISYFHAQQQRQVLTQPLQGMALFSLEPQDRAWLHRRIARRFEAMLAQGFIDEVRRLRARGDLRADMPSMRCVGYRQAWEILETLDEKASGGKTAKGTQAQEALQQLRERCTAATRQLARRQMTWLRSMPQRTVVHCDAPDALLQMLRLLEQTANQR